MSFRYAVTILSLGLVSSLSAGSVSAERLAIGPETSLHHCGKAICLLITGHRRSADQAVLVSGRAVPTAGGRRWRAMVPLVDLRDWSPPLARSVMVEVPGEGSAQADLPIGLLGHVTELAFLDVSARQ